MKNGDVLLKYIGEIINGPPAPAPAPAPPTVAPDMNFPTANGIIGAASILHDMSSLKETNTTATAAAATTTAMEDDGIRNMV